MKITYNKKELTLGNLVTENDRFKRNILSHFDLENETDQNSDWYQQFNSEVKEMNNFKKLTVDKNCFLDIGSQFGSFSLSFLGDSTTKKSYAFDGGINSYLVMSQIKHLNSLDNFHPYNFLIGNKNEMVNCFSEELQSLAIPGQDSRLMLSIDMIANLFNIQPEVMKIDVEGAEYDVLNGAYDTIINFKPIIFVEIHPKFMQMYNANVTNITNFVNSIGYTVLDLNLNIVDNYLDILKQEPTDSNRTIWIPKLYKV